MEAILFVPKAIMFNPLNVCVCHTLSCVFVCVCVCVYLRVCVDVFACFFGKMCVDASSKTEKEEESLPPLAPSLFLYLSHSFSISLSFFPPFFPPPPPASPHSGRLSQNDIAGPEPQHG